MKRSQVLKVTIILVAVSLLIFSLYSTWLEFGIRLSWEFPIGSFLREYAINFGPEAAGIALTVLILDFLNERRSEHHIEAQLKEQLVQESKSRNNFTAINAIEKLRVYGWLEDGTLSGVNFFGANLQDINFWQADLSQSNFRSVNLSNSSLRFADLSGSKNLTDEQLIKTLALRAAKMPTGGLYDGRYNLSGDIEQAKQQGFDPNVAESMSEYLQIPIGEYLAGQEWAVENLPTIRGSIATELTDDKPIQKFERSDKNQATSERLNNARNVILVSGIIALIFSVLVSQLNKSQRISSQ